MGFITMSSRRSAVYSNSCFGTKTITVQGSKRYLVHRISAYGGGDGGDGGPAAAGTPAGTRTGAGTRTAVGTRMVAGTRMAAGTHMAAGTRMVAGTRQGTRSSGVARDAPQLRMVVRR